MLIVKPILVVDTEKNKPQQRHFFSAFYALS